MTRARGEVLEIVADRVGDTFRAVYTVKFATAIYVLHAFQKKSKSGIKSAPVMGRTQFTNSQEAASHCLNESGLRPPYFPL